MKLLFIIPSLGMGGAERIVAALANHWSENHSVYIMTLTEEADHYSISENIRRYPLILSYKRWYNIGGIIHSISKIKKTFIDVNPDFIISFMTHPNLLSVFAGFGLKYKIIVCERNIIHDSHINRRLDFLRRKIYPYAYKITVQHNEIYQEFIETYPNIPQGKVYITPNPVEKFSFDDVHLNIKSFFPSFNADDKLIIGAGRFTPIKAFKDLINVFNAVHKRDHKVRLAILGDGSEYKDCIQLIKTFSLDGYVFLPGMVQNINPWYHAADIFVTTTFFEGFPNALAESLAAGLPAVAFDAPSIQVLLKDEKNGYVIKERNKESMAKKICFLLNNPEVYSRMSDEARKISEEYSMENINKIWFEKVLE